MYSRFRKPERALRVLILAVATAAVAACGENGETSVPKAPPGEPTVQSTPVPTLFPGGGAPPAPNPLSAKYAGDEHAIAEGARLYDWYNCAGCHFHGAGGIGPSLGDDAWTYGGTMENIYSTIYQGRPNGMPSWGQKLSTTEIWEIAAYVHSLPTTVGPADGPVPPLPAVREADARQPVAEAYPSAYPPGEAPPPQTETQPEGTIGAPPRPGKGGTPPPEKGKGKS